MSLKTLNNEGYLSQNTYSYVENSLKLTSVEVKYNTTSKDFDYELKQQDQCVANVNSICHYIMPYDSDESLVSAGTYVRISDIQNDPSFIYNPGIKYVCQVNSSSKIGFYVLGSNENMVTLISAASYKNATKWYSSKNNTYGPVAAMTGVQDKTSNWDNIDNIVINYNDYGSYQEGHVDGYGYKGIYTTIDSNGDYITKIYSDNNEVTGTFTNLKARLITLEDMYNIGKKIKFHETNKCKIYDISSLNWLRNYTTWSLSSCGRYGGYAIYVENVETYGGDFLIKEEVTNYTVSPDKIRIRPVIEVSKYDLNGNSGYY